MLDKRFARQYRYEIIRVSPDFALNSIVHHVSGVIITLLFKPSLVDHVSRCCSCLHQLLSLQMLVFHHHTRVSLRLLVSCFKTSGDEDLIRGIDFIIIW